jgi:hypothetical protein
MGKVMVMVRIEYLGVLGPLLVVLCGLVDG